MMSTILDHVARRPVHPFAERIAGQWYHHDRIGGFLALPRGFL